LFLDEGGFGRGLCCLNSMKLGVFIERDGILNREVLPLLKKLKAAGFVLIATTNQPGLSRGYQTRRELDRMHEALRRALPVDDILVCPHDETDRCNCRKPKAGLLVEAGFRWHVDLDHSFVISDKWQDAEAARSAGCTSLLLQSPWLGAGHRDFVLPDLVSIVEKILQLRVGSPAAIA